MPDPLKRRLLLPWTLVRGWGGPEAALILLAVGVLARLGPRRVPLLSVFTAADLSVPTAGLLGLLCALGVLAGTREPSDTLTVTSPRPVPALRAARVLLLAAGSVAAVAAGPGTTVAAAVTTVGALTGEQLLLAALVGRSFSWVAPMTHALAAITLGATSRGDIAIWAWFLDSHTSAVGTAASVLVFLTGTSTWAARSRTGDSAD